MHQFYVSAAGNTFISAYLMNEGESIPNRETIRKACAKYDADGCFVVKSFEDNILKLICFNQDGSLDGTFGNALAAATMVSKALGMGDAYSIQSCGKVHRTFITNGLVTVTIPDIQKTPEVVGNYYTINTGVPHIVIPMPKPVAPRDLASFAYNLISNWPGSDMVNVTMFSMGERRMHVSTYEYGVWRVVGSSASGILAAFNLARHLGKVRTSVTAETTSGFLIDVYSEWGAVTFTTPVEIIEEVRVF